MTSETGLYGSFLRFERALVRFESFVIGLCLFGIVVCTALGVYFRLSRISVPWTNEVAQIFLIWMMFSASTLGIYYNEHVGMSALVDRLSGRAKKIILVVGHLCVLAFCIYVAVTGAWYVSFTQRMGGGTVSLPYVIPSYLINLILPISFAFGTFHAIMALFDLDRRAEGPGEMGGGEHAFN